MNGFGLGWLDVALELDKQNRELDEENRRLRELVVALALALAHERDLFAFAAEEITHRFPGAA